MYSGPRITREQFANTRFLKITVTDFQKSYLHHSRFVFEVITDRSKELVKKKYNEVKRFSQQVYQRLGMKELAIEDHLRNSKREEEVQNLFKRLNAGYLMKEGDGNEVKKQVRNFLYNLLFSNIEHLPSSDEEDTVAQVDQVFKSEEAAKEKEVIKEMKEVKEAKEPKEGKIPNVIRNIFKSKRDSQDFRKKQQLLKNIKSIWLKTDKGWQQKILSAVTQDNLVLHDRGQPQFKHYIMLKFLSLQVQSDPVSIKLTHPLLKKNVELRINAPGEKESIEEQNNLIAVLREGCEKGDRYACNFFGLFLSNKKNKFMVEPQKRPAQRLSLKLQHEEETYLLSLPIDSSAYLQLPILNNYGKYDVQIVEEKETGIIPNLRENAITFSLPIQNIYDQIYNQKPKRKTPDMRSHILESKQCNYALRLDYFDLTSWRSYCSGTLKDRFQGIDKPAEFSRDEFRIQKNRFKRIIYSSQQFLSYVGGLMNWEYPVQSSFFYFLLLLIVLFFDANCILQYLLAIACAIMAYLHPGFIGYVKDTAILFAGSEPVKWVAGRLAQRGWQQKFRVAFKKGQEKRKFLQDFSMRKKKKRNILEKYNRLQEILLRGQLYLTEFVTITQKIKNLFAWYHHKKTKWLFLAFLASFFVLSFLPLRALALLALLKTCAKGRERRLITMQQNRAIASEMIRIVIEEQELVGMRECLDIQGKAIDKKSGEWSTFEKRMREGLGSVLQIDFDGAIFTEGKCLGEILDWLSQCRQRYIIPDDYCRKYKLDPSWAADPSTLRRLLLAAYFFITSVPSDRNILDTKQEEDMKEEQSDDQDLA